MQSSMRLCTYGIAGLIAVVSIGSPLLAAVALPVPELDGSSVAAGLGVLTAGILILRARRRSK
jgi:hypothetical protein